MPHGGLIQMQCLQMPSLQIGMIFSSMHSPLLAL